MSREAVARARRNPHGALIHLLVLLAIVVALGNVLRGVGSRRAV